MTPWPTAHARLFRKLPTKPNAIAGLSCRLLDAMGSPRPDKLGCRAEYLRPRSLLLLILARPSRCSILRLPKVSSSRSALSLRHLRFLPSMSLNLNPSLFYSWQLFPRDTHSPLGSVLFWNYPASFYVGGL